MRVEGWVLHDENLLPSLPNQCQCPAWVLTAIRPPHATRRLAHGDERLLAAWQRYSETRAAEEDSRQALRHKLSARQALAAARREAWAADTQQVLTRRGQVRGAGKAGALCVPVCTIRQCVHGWWW